MPVNLPRSNIAEVELTTKCTVKCECCPRNHPKNANRDWNVGHISTADLLKIIDDRFDEIVLGGAYGDPIYHPDIVEIITELKRRDIMISMDTNGSYMSEQHWMSLAHAFNIDDAITFSIDGSPENFTTYRVNADWPSIERGIKILSENTDAMLRWKYIVFRYNSDFESIQRAYDTAHRLGMRHFQLVHTKRCPEGQFVPVSEFSHVLDQLEEYVDGLPRPKPRLTINISPRSRKVADADRPKAPDIKPGVSPKRSLRRVTKVVVDNNVMDTEFVHPQCINLENHQQFLGADGVLYPCCYVYSDLVSMQTQFDLTDAELDSMRIAGRTIDEITAGPGYQKIIQSFDKSQTCRSKCPRKIT
jgi:organic radical activating enzyme